MPVAKPLPRALDIEQARRFVAITTMYPPMERALLLCLIYGGSSNREVTRALACRPIGRCAQMGCREGYRA